MTKLVKTFDHVLVDNNISSDYVLIYRPGDLKLVVCNQTFIENIVPQLCPVSITLFRDYTPASLDSYMTFPTILKGSSLDDYKI